MLNGSCVGLGRLISRRNLSSSRACMYYLDHAYVYITMIPILVLSQLHNVAGIARGPMKLIEHRFPERPSERRFDSTRLMQLIM